MELKIKDCDKVFFGENGLTSTAANHICNKAKELMKDKQSMLDNIRFYTTKVGLVSSDAQKVMSVGMDKDVSFDGYEYVITEIADVNAMIAWIKEGIKAKNNVIAQYKSMDEANAKEFEEETGLACPKLQERGKYLIAEDVIGTWSVDKRNKYYTLEALCSLLGKYIHPGGNFYQAKQQLDKVVANPVKIEGNGRDAMMFEYEPTKTSEEVKAEYAHLSSVLRHKEAELNQMKQEINDTVKDQNIEVDNEYNKSYSEYRVAYAQYNQEFANWIQKKQQIASKLKIHLPEGLMETYKAVSNA